MKVTYKIFWNRYVLVLLGFAAWMLFFDQNNIFRHLKLRQEVKSAQEQKQYYLNEMRSDSIFLEQLKNDPEVKEKFAREHYLMKRDSEIVFSIIREEAPDTVVTTK